MAVDTIKGRATAGTGNPEDIACTFASLMFVTPSSLRLMTVLVTEKKEP